MVAAEGRPPPRVAAAGPPREGRWRAAEGPPKRLAGWLAGGLVSGLAGRLVG